MYDLPDAAKRPEVTPLKITSSVLSAVVGIAAIITLIKR